MHPAIILRVLGVLLMIYSTTMLPPVAVALYYHDGGHVQFLTAFGITLISGLICWLPVHSSRDELRVKDGFLVVVLCWTNR